MTEQADDYVYRFQYADKSAFQIYDDGRAFIVYPDGRKEQKFGEIDNRIRLLVGKAAKPRQDRIDVLLNALTVIRHVANAPGDRRALINEIYDIATKACRSLDPVGQAGGQGERS